MTYIAEVVNSIRIFVLSIKDKLTDLWEGDQVLVHSSPIEIALWNKYHSSYRFSRQSQIMNNEREANTIDACKTMNISLLQWFIISRSHNQTRILNCRSSLQTKSRRCSHVFIRVWWFERMISCCIQTTFSGQTFDVFLCESGYNPLKKSLKYLIFVPIIIVLNLQFLCHIRFHFTKVGHRTVIRRHGFLSLNDHNPIQNL